MAFLALVILAAAVFRAYRAAEPFGGYLAYNDAFYATLAHDYAAHGVFSPLTHPLDYNNPPLLALLLVATFKILGISEATARAVPISMNLLTILYTYGLGRALYSPAVGILGATSFAFSPGSVLIGRNVQPDALMTFFMVAALFHYVLGARGERLSHAGVGGVLMGFGLLAKMPAVLAVGTIVLWELWRHRSLGWLRARPTMVFAAGLLITGLPWYLGHLLSHSQSSHIIGANEELLATFRWPTVDLVQSTCAELIGMLSPIVFAAAIASAVLLTMRRNIEDVLVMLGAALVCVFYAFFHYHSYYLFPVTVFVAIAVGVALERIGMRTWRAALPASVVIGALSAFYAFLLMGGQKYGKTALADVERHFPPGPSPTVLAIAFPPYASNWPVFKYYAQHVRLTRYPMLQGEGLRKGERLVVVDWMDSADTTNLVMESALLNEDRQLILCGLAFHQTPPFTHRFATGPLQVDWVGPLSRFGIRTIPQPSGFGLFVPKEVSGPTP